MIIAIGSTNRIKIQAVKTAFKGVKGEFIACEVPSNVRNQPLDEEETQMGAINRAQSSLSNANAELGIGLEAGVFFREEKVYLCHWGALVNRYHKTFVTNGPIIRLPDQFKHELMRGRELNAIMQDHTGIHLLGSKEGAVSIFTCGGINREQLLSQIVKALWGQHQFYLE